jgi:hypothetical protein
MGANVDKVLDNFEFRIEEVTPTFEMPELPPHFTAIDNLRNPPDETEGLTRVFELLWVGADMENVIGERTVSDGLFCRTAEHRFKIDMFYSNKLGRRWVQKAVLRDRHDIIRHLRLPDTWVGVSLESSAGDIGLDDRVREEEELEPGDPFWTHTTIWKTVIRESEDR